MHCLPVPSWKPTACGWDCINSTSWVLFEGNFSAFILFIKRAMPGVRFCPLKYCQNVCLNPYYDGLIEMLVPSLHLIIWIWYTVSAASGQQWILTFFLRMVGKLKSNNTTWDMQSTLRFRGLCIQEVTRTTKLSLPDRFFAVSGYKRMRSLRK